MGMASKEIEIYTVRQLIDAIEDRDKPFWRCGECPALRDMVAELERATGIDHQRFAFDLSIASAGSGNASRFSIRTADADGTFWELAYESPTGRYFKRRPGLWLINLDSWEYTNDNPAEAWVEAVKVPEVES